MSTRKTQKDIGVTRRSAADTAVKMQKLRRAVDRLRNLRGLSASPPKRSSWFQRLKLRLGLTGGSSSGVEEEA